MTEPMVAVYRATTTEVIGLDMVSLHVALQQHESLIQSQSRTGRVRLLVAIGATTVEGTDHPQEVP